MSTFDFLMAYHDVSSSHPFLCSSPRVCVCHSLLRALSLSPFLLSFPISPLVNPTTGGLSTRRKCGAETVLGSSARESESSRERIEGGSQVIRRCQSFRVGSGAGILKIMY